MRISSHGQKSGHIGLDAHSYKSDSEEIHFKKMLAALVAGAFAIASVGAFAAAHSGAQPAKDAPKVDCKDPKNKDHKDCAMKDDKKK